MQAQTRSLNLLILNLRGETGGWSTSHPIRFTPKREPRDPLNGRLCGFGASLDGRVEEKIFCVLRDPKPKPSIPWRVANFLRYPGSHFILWLIELPDVFRKNVIETTFLCLSPHYPNSKFHHREGGSERSRVLYKSPWLRITVLTACWISQWFVIIGTPIIHGNLKVAVRVPFV